MDGRLGSMTQFSGENWNGVIDDIRIYDAALTSKDVELMAKVSGGDAPAAPKDLKATPAENNEIKLKWTDYSNNESIFKIQRSEDGTKFESVALVRTNFTTFSDILPYDMDAWYRVVAWNPYGESQPSNVVKTGTLADNLPPALVSVQSFIESPGDVTVIFNEPMDTDSSQNPENYAITPDVRVVSAVLNEGYYSVHLKAEGLKPDIDYKITVHYVKDRSRARNTIFIPVTHPFRLATNRNGLKGEYFNTRDLSGKPVEHYDNEINFDWSNSVPFENFSRENISVRWTGWIEAPSNGKFTLTILSDDGARMWVGGKQVFNDWKDRGPTESNADVQMKTGERIPIKIEYYQGGGGACCKFYWEGPDTPKAIVPFHCLFSSVDSGDNVSSPINGEKAPIPAKEDYIFPLKQFSTDKAFTLIFENRDNADCLKAAGTEKGFPYIDTPLQDQKPDWTPWTFLRIEVESDHPALLIIRLDDVNAREQSARYIKETQINPGWNTIEVPLKDIAKAHDISQMRRIVLYLETPPKDTTLWYKSIKLSN
jgi:hypothetical protein